MSTLTIRGDALAFNDSATTGPGISASAPVLVLIHGFPLDSRIWDNVLPELTSHFRVITLDLRGFGNSVSNLPFSIESLADDIHDVLESLHAFPCTIAGLSMGGYVVLAYAAKYPLDLAGLVLVDTKAEADTSQAKTGRNEMVTLVREKGSAAIAAKMEPNMVCEHTRQHRPLVVERLRQLMNACPPLTIEHSLTAMRDRPDYTLLLSQLKSPAMVVVGEHDAIAAPPVAQRMSQQIPACKLVTIKDAGHMAPLEQPAQVAQALLDFLRQ